MRYQLYTPDDFDNNELKVYRSDWDDYQLYLVDTKTGTVIGSDGGEPEDQTFNRDWSWVPDALNTADQDLSNISNTDLLEELKRRGI